MKISIYSIVGVDDENLENIYVGSTQNLKQRNRQHKSACNSPNDKEYNKPLYKFIRTNGGWENFILEEFTTKEVETKQQALELERGYIELMNATLNKQNPGKILELGKEQYNKEYREANSEKLKQQIKKINYQKVLCPYCNIEFMKAHKTQHYRTKKHQQNQINSLN